MTKNNWQKVKLGEYIKVKHGYAFPGNGFTMYDNGNLLLTPGNFKLGGGFQYTAKFFDQDYAKEYVLNSEDLIVTMTDLSKNGDTLGYPALIPQNDKYTFLHNQRVGLVEFHREGLDKKFLFNLMRTKSYQRYIVNSSSGSTVRHTSPSKIEGYEVVIPNLFIQKSIASIFLSLDDKIELLRKQNKTLENVAQTLFKRWFVDFNFPDENGNPYKEAGGKMVGSEIGEIPDAWEVGVLKDEFVITMGQSPEGSSYNENKEGVVFYQGRAEFGERFPLNRLHTTKPKRMAQKFDVLISVRAPVGDINVANEECCIGRGLAAIRSEFKSYCLYKIKSFKGIFEQFESEGTVFGSINKSGLEEMNCIIPRVELAREFDQVVKETDLKIYNNFIQIQTLSKLRDTLLPKLMNGEININ